ncbi:MAG: hypothetical protein IKC63_07040 [Clostridia bacterium]|nr:hypothetical protein [Clostridia bacterium]
MKKLTLVSLILAIVLTALLASCSDAVVTTQNETTTTAPTTTDATVTTTDKTPVTDAPTTTVPTTTVPTTTAPTTTPVTTVPSTEAPKVTTEKKDDGETPTPSTITIAKALELCGESGNVTTERYLIRATVKAITNPAYGAMVLVDETGEIEVYGSYSADGETRYGDMTEKPYKGDTVLVSCILQNYNGTKEVKSAWIIEFKAAEVDTDTSNYTDMTALEARNAALGTKIKLDGVVARITYANGMIPSGFILVDNTNAIYVYDRDAAGRVKIGDTVTVAASKTYWVLETEQSSADKFGYKGCCQLESVVDIKVQDTKSDFDKSWITSTTVKALLATPVTENITTTIFKVNAQVKKVDGNGFVNYYINDIDGLTGSYTYTQCSGSDFAWLDAFDGKICTVYLSILNAKSSSSGCIYRFLPVAVVDEGYTFNKDNAPKFALDYFVLDQFKTLYTGDPMLEVLTTVSSELLGLSDIAISYTSSDAAVVNFAVEDGKTVMHCLKSGTATVTIKATYNGKSATETITVKVDKPESIEADLVKAAIAAKVGDTVTVKGIVGPSLVNRDGFYLFNDDAMIAVLTTTDVLADLEIGQEIVIEGLRDLFNNPEKGSNEFGQTCITNAVVKANMYGKHEYSTDFFITDKTLKDVYDLDYTVDHSTEVYVVKATIQVVETAYYTNIKVVDGSTTLSLYCSSAKQYSFLTQFAGEEVTLEIAPCNWNDKDYWAGCVLAVRTDDGKVINSLNFTSN